MGLKILAPTDNAAEAEALIRAGAGALYFGFHPVAWQAEHSPLESFNRRTFAEAQVDGRDEVVRLVEAARRGGATLAVTFNAAAYSDALYGPLLETVDWLAQQGVTHLIVADPGLIALVRGRTGVRVSLSTLAGAYNRETVAFFRDLGVERVTLPRELSIGEIVGLTRACPETVFDVFALFGACPNAESFCRWPHDDPRRIWPCVKPYTVHRYPGGEVGREPAFGVWAGVERAWACGLCALWDLHRLANVEGLKVVGRGAPSARKLLGVKVLRTMLEAVESGLGREACLARARELRRVELGQACSPTLCCYPEFLP